MRLSILCCLAATLAGCPEPVPTDPPSRTPTPPRRDAPEPIVGVTGLWTGYDDDGAAITFRLRQMEGSTVTGTWSAVERISIGNGTTGTVGTPSNYLHPSLSLTLDESTDLLSCIYRGQMTGQDEMNGTISCKVEGVTIFTVTATLRRAGSTGASE